jgi:hypothetical protein
MLLEDTRPPRVRLGILELWSQQRGLAEPRSRQKLANALPVARRVELATQERRDDLGLGAPSDDPHQPVNDTAPIPTHR